MRPRPFPASRALCALAVTVLFAHSVAAARTHIVRAGDSIQAAIDLASSGDLILLLPGEYRESLTIADKSLRLRGLGFQRPTIVLLNSGLDPSIGLRITGTAAAGSALQGIRFTTDDPGGLVGVALEADATIRNCRFEGFQTPLGVQPPAGPAISVSEGVTASVTATSIADCLVGIDNRGDLTLIASLVSNCQEGLVGKLFLDPAIGSARLIASRFEDSRFAVRGSGQSMQVSACVFERCEEILQLHGDTQLHVADSAFLDFGRDIGRTSGAAINAGAAVMVERCLFAGGGGIARFAGVIRVVSSDPFVLRDSRFEANRIGLADLISLTAASIEVTGCTFSDNVAGLVFVRSTGPTLVDSCRFEKNSAGPQDLGLRVDGAGTISNCSFLRNGHASLVSAPDSELVRCRFVDNGSDQGRPAVDCSQIVGCTFLRNRLGLVRAPTIRASSFLGNIDADVWATANFTNALFVGNEGEIASDNRIGCTIVDNVVDFFTFSGTPSTIGCIVRGNTGGPAPALGATVTHSNVEGIAGAGNIDADPLFLRAPSPGPDGAWGTRDDDYGDLRLQPASPCIDAGDSTAFAAGVDTDAAGQPRFIDAPAVPDTGVPAPGRAVADMGAFEFQGAGVACLCDTDENGRVDVRDLLAFLRDWLDGDSAADANADQAVDVHDLLAFIDCWSDARAGGCP